MEFRKIHLIGIIIGSIVLIISLFLIGNSLFFLVLGGGILVITFPFVLTAINETRMENEKEEMFLEFTRNLVESVKTGTPISKSIMNVKNKSYGFLQPNVNKLANQIAMGIPLSIALQTFSKDVNNRTVSRTLTLIGQAEKVGGDIGEILESVAEAVTMSDRLKKERKAAISTLVVQGYIIFFVFMIIILIMQFRILPIVSGISGLSDLSGGGLGGIGSGEPISAEELSSSFLYLLLIQGFFTGLTIGKLSEGTMKAGIKHSFTLILISFLVSALANVLLG